MSAAAGLFAYLQLLGATGLRELANLTEVQRDKYNRHVSRVGKAYFICVVGLGTGLISSSTAFIASIWPADKMETTPTITIAGTDQDGLPLVLRKSGPKTEVLVSKTGSQLEWVQVTLPEEPVAQKGPK